MEMIGNSRQRARVSSLAKQWLELGPNGLILDTETTGLGSVDEIVELSVIDMAGRTLINTLVKPKGIIPPEAQRIHGISNEGVSDAPTWAEVYPLFKHTVQGKKVVIYNASYDTRIIEQTTKLAGLTDPDFLERFNLTVECAMEAYAEYWGEWDDGRMQYKWQKLTNAAKQCGLQTTGAHRALADCLMTLGVVRSMAGFTTDGQQLDIEGQIKEGE